MGDIKTDYAVFNAVLRATDEYLPREKFNGATTDECRYTEFEYRSMLDQYRLRLDYERGDAYYIPELDKFVPLWFANDVVDARDYSVLRKEIA